MTSGAHEPQPGEVWLVVLDPTQGSEIRKTRPCVIVSPIEMNRHLATVIVAPMTTTIRRYPSRVGLRFQGRQSEAALDQIRAIDKSRLRKKLGAISEAAALEIADVMMEMFRYR